MDDDAQLRAKLRKIEALFAGAGTDGERESLPLSGTSGKRGVAKIVLPGYFRPTKQWDLLIIVDGKLLGTLELKAHVGFFGNNANNRAEEALGNATDLCYSAACLIVSDKEGGRRGRYREPSPELSFANFVGSLSAYALGYAKGSLPRS